MEPRRYKNSKKKKRKKTVAVSYTTRMTAGENQNRT